jgi:hypothetical protein
MCLVQKLCKLTIDVRFVSGGRETSCRGFIAEHEVIEALVPEGSPGPASVQVVLGRIATPVAAEHCLTFPSPHILSCTKSGRPSDHFVISGRNFGFANGVEIVVMIGSGRCGNVSVLRPHETIEAIVPDDSGTNLPVTVQINGQGSTAEKSCTLSYKGEVGGVKTRCRC